MADEGYPLAYVEWNDSHSYRGTWESLQDIVKHGRPSVVRSVGWIISETDEWIILVAHLSNVGEADADPFGFSDLSIPKTAIVKRFSLESVLLHVQREGTETECPQHQP